MHSCQGNPWLFQDVHGALEQCTSLHGLDAPALRPYAAV